MPRIDVAMTPARLAALAISLVLLVGAVWLVFVGVPKTSAPPPTTVAGVPSPGASPGSRIPTGKPQSSEVPGSPETSPGANATAASTQVNPLLKEIPAHSVDPAQLIGYIWPVNHALITRSLRSTPGVGGRLRRHRRSRLSRRPRPRTHCDDKVHSAHDGTVLYAGRDFDPFLGYQGDAEAIYDRLQKLGRHERADRSSS